MTSFFSFFFYCFVCEGFKKTVLNNDAMRALTWESGFLFVGSAPLTKQPGKSLILPGKVMEHEEFDPMILRYLPALVICNSYRCGPYESNVNS